MAEVGALLKWSVQPQVRFFLLTLDTTQTIQFGKLCDPTLPDEINPSIVQICDCEYCVSVTRGPGKAGSTAAESRTEKTAREGTVSTARGAGNTASAGGRRTTTARD